MSKKSKDNLPKSIKTEYAIKSKLDERFIETDEIASVISLAVQSNKNVLFYGPAGFGKSEMIEHITTSLFPPAHCQDCKDKFKAEGLSLKDVKEQDFCGDDDQYCGTRPHNSPRLW